MEHRVVSLLTAWVATALTTFVQVDQIAAQMLHLIQIAVKDLSAQWIKNVLQMLVSEVHVAKEKIVQLMSLPFLRNVMELDAPHTVNV